MRTKPQKSKVFCMAFLGYLGSCIIFHAFTVGHNCSQQLSTFYTTYTVFLSISFKNTYNETGMKNCLQLNRLQRQFVRIMRYETYVLLRKFFINNGPVKLCGPSMVHGSREYLGCVFLRGSLLCIGTFS